MTPNSSRSEGKLQGLSTREAERRLQEFGPNALPEAKTPSFILVFFRQFLSPLIYILLIAALISLLIGDVTDAFFIGIVLFVNGLIGAFQEYSAGKAAAALKHLEEPRARVIRDGEEEEIEARLLVPDDLVLLEAGTRVPADVRLLQAHDLRCDESLLTGESDPVKKGVDDQAFAGSLMTRGRGCGLVTATGLKTELGKIAEKTAGRSLVEPPLMVRMRRFTNKIAWAVAAVMVPLILMGLWRGMGVRDLFLMAVGLAVSAIPEGLPIAISVALAIAMRRMAKHHVIVRNMPAVEALGSCTLIATDKTGTLTLNELTVTDLCLADGTRLSPRSLPEGEAVPLPFQELLQTAILANEGQLKHKNGTLQPIGDRVDTALLTLARRWGMARKDVLAAYPEVGRIAYEPDLKYAASFHRHGERLLVFVKGAPEVILSFCDRMQKNGTHVPIDPEALAARKEEMAAAGLRILAFAKGEAHEAPQEGPGPDQLEKLIFLGFAGMRDPVRPEVPEALYGCQAAGIQVVMITGDDPKTAHVIGQHAGLEAEEAGITTGAKVRRAEEMGEAELDRLTKEARIYARVEPSQKLAIVSSLARNGHFVAVTGDGINDAPALKNAHVGVAMGRKGTDVAKESADIILTDDNFASIVAGVREGRVAYANIRKVIFLLTATGIAEVMLFLLAMIFATPMPLLPVQLLWLNLVTNGIQDVALAGEGAEGNELEQPPRKPGEPIFDALMINRIAYAAAVMGFGGFAVFYGLLMNGYTEAAARNLLLLLFVLFENFLAFSSRSEQRSIFRMPLFGNPFLIFGIIGAQMLHITALYIPDLSSILDVTPVTLTEWVALLLLASFLLLVMEIGKWWDRRKAGKGKR